MKNLKLILFVVLIYFISSENLLSQEISINSIFTHDTVFFPFENIESISEMTIEGEVTLSQDTSLVRVIVEDDLGVQYMIFEAYPLITMNSYFSFAQYCDETCFLDLVNPYSIIIQVIDASLNLKKISYTTEAKENCEEERYNAKRSKDASKIATMNQLIPSYNMNWVSGDNAVVATYYDQKRNLFGDGYNLHGYDYYQDGVFEFLGHRNYPKVDPDLVRSFDWRNRHGANDSLSAYWDGDNYGTGWLTKEQSQYPCGSCWAFSAVGAVEAIANLYAGHHINYDLSEQDMLSCSFAGTCDGGNEDSVLQYIKYNGIVTENCFPYYGLDYYTLPCTSNLKCDYPDTIIRITDKLKFRPSYGYNYDSVRIKLITKGPLTFSYEESPLNYHAVVLIGFEFDPQDSTLSWIIKNSNISWGKRGFGKLKLETYIRAFAVVPPIFHNDTALEVECHDYDNDGYCFWGIGVKPESCDSCNCSDIEDCDDNDSFVGGYDENYNCSCLLEMDSVDHHISVNTIWSDTTFVNYKVIIDSGAILTINSYAAFAPQAGIVVKQGGKLVLDSAYLTKACPDLWRGIEVLGSDTVQGFDEYFGKIVMQNHAIIEFAKLGIANHCVLGYNDSLQSGGIIVAHHSTFRDNETDVLFAPFRNEWLGRELPYEGSFVDCQFITTDNLYPDYLPKAHIEMKDIYGVMIYGSRFENQSNIANQQYSLRGTGISSIDSYFMIHPYCLYPNTIPCQESDTCTFSLLEYGIKAMNSLSKRTLNIRGLKFDQNFLSISLSGLESASVLSNDFHLVKEINGMSTNRFTGGLFMEGCTGYHVEDNFFHGVLGQFGVPGKGSGIGIKNSGPENNEIYNNTFYRANAGIFVIGENRGQDTSGLCLKCNAMIDNINDFLVVADDGPPTGIQGIRFYQGNPNDTISATGPAGNTFTDYGNSPADFDKKEKFNYYNDVEDIYYLHHLKQLDPLTYPLDSNYTQETIELMEISIQYNKSTACPSDLGEEYLKSLTNPRQIIFEADNNITFLKSQLNSLVDGGNTVTLNFEVLTSLPDEGLEIRQQLLNESPYLSDTVLKQAIYKEGVLPNAMIRDIMEVNPQSAKKSGLLEALDERFEPMPDYMMAQILEGRNHFGAKELLEVEIQSCQQIRSKAKNELMRLFLLDTNMFSPLDSVIAFLANENDLKSKYDLAFAYWNKQDTVQAMLTINGALSHFTLNNIQSTVHQQYINYFGILKQIEDNHWRACDLDSSSVLDLFNLMEEGDADIMAHARGLLVKGGFLKYVETVNLSDFTKSSKPHFTFGDKLTRKFSKDYLRLFPNPAGDYVIAYYNIESKYQSFRISIHDMKGNLLGKYLVNPGENQMVIDIKNLPNGIYLLGLYVNDKLMENEKLSKGRY